MSIAPHTEHRLAPREFPLVTHDPANPASGRLGVTLRGDSSRMVRALGLVADKKTTNGVYLCGFKDGRKSVDRWAPAFAGLIVGCVLTALIILVGASVLS